MRVPLRYATVLTLIFAVLAVGSAVDVSAKVENPPGTIDVGPAVVGTMTFKSGQLIDFKGKCGDIKVKIKDYQGLFDLQTLAPTDLVDPVNNLEFQFLFAAGEVPPELIQCYGLSAFDGLLLVFKSVSDFEAFPPTGTRRIVEAEVVLLRRVTV